MEFDYYKNQNSESPVEADLMSMQEKRRKLVTKKIAYYEEKTSQELRRGGHLIPIRGINYDLFELKFYISPPYRAICFFRKLKWVLLHAFTKKNEGAIPKRHIDIAVARAKEYDNR
jgi:phage-related protein